MPHAVELPPPRDWQVFEDFCCDLFAAEWSDPDAQKYGRSGQKQHGVDVYGRRDGRWQAVQCKRKRRFPESKLKEAQVRGEIEEAYKFSRPLETLVIATTAPPDIAIQDLAAKFTDQHREESDEKKRFRVIVYGWEELCEKLLKHPGLCDVWRGKLLGSTPKRDFVAESRKAERSSRRRDVQLIAAVVLLLGLATGWALSSRREAPNIAHEERVQARVARDQARVAIASQWHEKDPTAAALILLELEEPQKALYASQKMYGVLARPVTRFEFDGHTESVSSASFSPDGTRVLTTSSDDTARIWDSQSGVELAVLEGHADMVWEATFDADGTRVVTASIDGTARIWDAQTGTELATLEGHTQAVYGVRWSADGTRVLSASGDGTARIWDAASGEEVKTFRGASGELLPTSLDPDGTRIVTTSGKGTAWIWDAASGDRVATLEGHTDLILFSSFSTDGRYVVTVSKDGTVRVWTAESGYHVSTLEGQERQRFLFAGLTATRLLTLSLFEDSDSSLVLELWDMESLKAVATLEGPAGLFSRPSFSGYEWRIVAPSLDGTARIWDAVTGRKLAMLQGHPEALSAVSFSPDERSVVTGSRDGTARIWDVTPGAELAVLMGSKRAWISTDGTRVVTRSNEGAVRLWNIASMAQEAADEEPRGLIEAFSSDGRLMLSGLHRAAQIRDIVSGAERARFELTEYWELEVASFSADAKQVAAVLESDSRVHIWDVASGIETATLEGHTSAILDTSFSADGARVVTASIDGTARIWDAASGVEVARLEHKERAWIWAASFNADGTLVLTLSESAPPRIWEAATGAEKSTLVGHTDDINSASFSRDGRRVVTASEDGTARIWDAATGKSIITLTGHSDEVRSAFFSPDDKRVVTASTDATARIWDAATGVAIAMLDHPLPVIAASFSADGKRVVTVSADHTVRFWASGSEVELLEALMRERTTLCLEPPFRQEILGETPAEAELSYESCRWCSEKFHKAQRSNPDRLIRALRNYKLCTKKAGQLQYAMFQIGQIGLERIGG